MHEKKSELKTYVEINAVKKISTKVTGAKMQEPVKA